MTDLGTPLSEATAGYPLVIAPPRELLERLNDRQPSFSQQEGYRDGADYAASLPQNKVLAAGTQLEFSPEFAPGSQGLGGLAYAIYDFTLPDPEPGLSVSLDWAAAPGFGTLHIALGDFSRDRWQWLQPEQLDSLTIAQATPYFGPDSRLLLVCALTGTQTARLDALQLKGVQVPTAKLSVDKSSGELPLTVSFDASQSSDPDGSLVSYEWDFDGDGLFNEAGAETLAFNDPLPAAFTYLQAGNFEAALRVTDNDGAADTAVRTIRAGQALAVSLQADLVAGDKPLAVQFSAQVSAPGGSIDLIRWDFDADGQYSGSPEELAAQNEAAPSAYLYTQVGNYAAAVQVLDSAGDVAEDSLNIAVGNSPPQADLQADVTEGDAPLLVRFDGTASADPGGSLVAAEWDFDGDLIFGETGAELAAQGDLSPAAQSFSQVGFTPVYLRVTDDDTAASVASINIITHGWSHVPVDAEMSGDVGTYCAMALINGNPAIAYRDEANNAVKYACSASAYGLLPGDWSAVTVDTTGLLKPGTGISLANVVSHPAISYSDSESATLIYQWASEASGLDPGSWPEPLPITDNSECGDTSSLCLIDGRPAIIFDNLSTGQLMYAHSATQSGSNAADWSTVFPLEGDAANYSYNGVLTVVNGQPAYTCSHYNGSGLELHYCRSATAAGDSAADWSAKTVLPFAAAESCLALTAGRPSIACRDAAGGIGFARSLDDDGLSWGDFCFPDSACSGLPLGLTQIQGNPALVYYAENLGDLLYVRSSTPEGQDNADWTEKVLIAGAASDCGSHLSFCRLSSGRPAIAYRDETAGSLMFAAWQ